MAIGKKRIGGALILGAAWFIGRESIAWLWGRALDIASAGFGSVSIASFPWQSALATIMALAGGYLAFWPDKRAKQPSAQQKARRLGQDADYMAARVNNHRQWSAYTMETRDPLVGVVRDGFSLLLTFEKGGYRIPNLSSHESAERVAYGIMNYFQSIAPLLRDGHLEEAKTASETFARNAERAATALQIENFR